MVKQSNIISADKIRELFEKDKRIMAADVPTVAKTEIQETRAKLVTADAERARLEQQVEELAKKLQKQNTSTNALREWLNEHLNKHGIKAAFEPLIEMAIERYPQDYVVPELRGMFKLDADQRIKIWTEILSYQLPKLKAIEVGGQVDMGLTVIVRRFGGGDAVIERQVTPAAIPVQAEVTPEIPGVSVRKFNT